MDWSKVVPERSHPPMRIGGRWYPAQPRTTPRVTWTTLSKRILTMGKGTRRPLFNIPKVLSATIRPKSHCGVSREYDRRHRRSTTGLKQADIDAGIGSDGLTTEERSELRALRRGSKRLHMEREISRKPRPGLLGRATRSRIRVRVHDETSARVPCAGNVPCAGSLLQRVLVTRPDVAGQLRAASSLDRPS
jgi:hypothetical protein